MNLYVLFHSTVLFFHQLLSQKKSLLDLHGFKISQTREEKKRAKNTLLFQNSLQHLMNSI